MIKFNGKNNVASSLNGKSVQRMRLNGETVWERDYFLRHCLQRHSALSRGMNPSYWDDFVGMNHGVVLRSTWDTDALSFNGNNRVTFVGDITPAYTIEVVFECTINLAQSYPRIVNANGSDNYHGIYIFNNGNANHAEHLAIRFYGGGKDVSFTAPDRSYVKIEEGKRTQVAYQYGNNGNVVDLFVNGIYAGSVTGISAPKSTPLNYLGANATETRFLTGSISEFRRHDIPLSNEIIQHNYKVDKYNYGLD